MGNHTKLLYIFLSFLLLGCSSQKKSNSNSSCSDLKFIDSKQELNGIHVYVLCADLFFQSEHFDKKEILESVTASLKKLGCTVYLDQIEILKQPKLMDRCDRGWLDLFMGNLLVHYSKTDESGASGGYRPMIGLRLEVKTSVQIIATKNNTLAPLWKSESYFEEPNDLAQINAAAAERIELLLKKFVEQYQRANHGSFPTIHVLDF